MLLLSRRANEKLIIGKDIVITVCHIGGGQVRLGIEAPRHVAVHREEVFQRLQQEQSGAVASFAK